MDGIYFKNLDQTESFQSLKGVKKDLLLSNLLSAERAVEYSLPTGGGLYYNYAAKLVNGEILNLLSRLAIEQQAVPKYLALLSGEVMNTGENRMVLHHLTRGRIGHNVIHEGENIGDFYLEQQERIYEFAAGVHSGRIKGSTGKHFDTVVQIGIGGSDLGPRALYLALSNCKENGASIKKMNAFFISNVDPDDAVGVLNGLDLEKTLFILVSKSGTTQETLTNREFVLHKMKSSGISGFDPKRHMVAVTSSQSPLSGSPDYLDSFYIDDFIGGRYSSTSAVGGTVLTLAFGREIFSRVLAGAHEADKKAIEKEPLRNPSLLDALIGVYERNILGYPATAVLPYSQALVRFPAHLQQLDMESNGKRVNRFGEPVSYQTGPVIFGEPGTNGQHSFYQLLHQGTDIVPLQFIAFKKSQAGEDMETEGSTSQEKLNANLAAQIAAFAMGKNDSNKNRHFPGNRPSSLIYGSVLSPESAGALLAHFENKVMFQGFIWNLNSFDQEGVQLGKKLTTQILKRDTIDPALQGFVDILM